MKAGGRVGEAVGERLRLGALDLLVAGLVGHELAHRGESRHLLGRDTVGRVGRVGRAGDQRLLLWIPALALDLAAPVAGYWLPGRGRAATTDYDIEGGHFAERCQLFIIIALGESIVVTGASAADAGSRTPIPVTHPIDDRAVHHLGLERAGGERRPPEAGR